MARRGSPRLRGALEGLRRIASELAASGHDALPSIAELAGRLGVSRVTAWKAVRALCAEGVHCMPKEYFLVYDMPIYRDKTAYERSRCPWDCPSYGKEISYQRGLCPNAEDFLARTVAITWHHTLTEEAVRPMADAIRKVAEWYRR